MDPGFRYDAFVSYANAGPDRRVAERVVKLIESYHAPKKLSGRRKVSRLFLDRLELAAAPFLADELCTHLHDSRFLIVVCSPRSKTSHWVDAEVQEFCALERRANILPLLLEGEPEQVFPTALASQQPLAADIRATSLRRSLGRLDDEKLRLLAPLLGCRYDDLRERHERRKRLQRVPYLVTAAILMVTLIVTSIVNGRAARSARIDALEAQAKAELDEDPGKAMALIVEAARLGDGFTDAHVLLARAACEKGVGWVLGEHADQVSGVALSRQSPLRLASISLDGTVRIYDLTSGSRTVLSIGPAAVTSVIFSIDGKFVIAGSRAGGIHVWTAVDGREVHVIDTPAGVLALDVSSDGSMIYGGLNGGQVIGIWTDTWKSVSLFEHAREVRQLLASPQGRVVASADTAGGLAVAAVLEDRSVVRDALDDPRPFGIQSLSFSSDGRRLAAAGARYLATFKVAATTRSITLSEDQSSVDPGSGSITRVVFSPDGDRLAIGDQQGAVSTLSSGSLKRDWELTHHDGAVLALRWSMDGDWVASTGADGTVRVTFRQGWGRTFHGHVGPVWAMAMAGDGSFVVSGGNDGIVRLWPVEPCRPYTVTAPDIVLNVAGAAPLDRLLASTPDGGLWQWRGLLTEPQRLTGASHSMCMIDGDHYALSGWGVTRVWNVATTEMERREMLAGPLACVRDRGVFVAAQPSLEWLEPPNWEPSRVGAQEARVIRVAASPDGQLVASLLPHGTVELRVAGGAPEKLLDLHDATAVAASNTHVIVGTRSGFVGIYHRDSKFWAWRSIHRGGVHAVAISPDGELFASAGEDAQIALGSIRSQALWMIGGVSPFYAVAFDLRGEALIAGSGDGRIRVFRLAPCDTMRLREWLVSRVPWQVVGDELAPVPFHGVQPGFRMW